MTALTKAETQESVRLDSLPLNASEICQGSHDTPESSSEAPEFQCVVLACGFTPLHLSTYLGAYLQQSFADRKVAVISGAYGDLIGAVRRAATENPDALAIALEWTDLDPRLGYRQLGGWGPAQARDSVQMARAALGRLADAIKILPAGCSPSRYRCRRSLWGRSSSRPSAQVQRVGDGAPAVGPWRPPGLRQRDKRLSNT